MTIRDLMAQRDLMAGQMQQVLQQMQQIPVAGQSDLAESSEGGLVAGQARKLQH